MIKFKDDDLEPEIRIHPPTHLAIPLFQNLVDINHDWSLHLVVCEHLHPSVQLPGHAYNY